VSPNHHVEPPAPSTVNDIATALNCSAIYGMTATTAMIATRAALASRSRTTIAFVAFVFRRRLAGAEEPIAALMIDNPEVVVEEHLADSTDATRGDEKEAAS